MAGLYVLRREVETLCNCAESAKSSSAFDSYFNNQGVSFSMSGPKPTDVVEKKLVLPASLN